MPSLSPRRPMPSHAEPNCQRGGHAVCTRAPACPEMLSRSPMPSRAAGLPVAHPRTTGDDAKSDFGLGPPE
eukprot:scaffold1449_cov324-Prasinococcus_capsulatus_cf.AAC.17